MARMSKKAAFHEVFHDVPSTVKKTGKTGTAKRKMMVAIALSKAGMSKDMGEMKKGHRLLEVCKMGKR